MHHRKTVFQGNGSHSFVSGESRCATPDAWRPDRTRVLEVADEVTMVASRADESCAMVSSLTEEVQQREEIMQLCRMWS